MGQIASNALLEDQDIVAILPKSYVSTVGGIFMAKCLKVSYLDQLCGPRRKRY